MRVLITGATGFIGSALTLRLQRDNHQVVAWARSPANAQAALGPDVTVIDAADPDALRRQVAVADAIINLAGAPILDKRWTAKRRETLRQSRIGVTDAIVSAIEAASPRPRVLISASAVGIYTDRGDRPITEDAPLGDGFAAELCAAWEHESKRAEALGVRVVNPRIGVVLGHGGMLAKVLPMFRAGLGGRIGSGRQFLPWIHIDDVVNALVLAMYDERCMGPINLVAPRPARYNELVDELGRIERRPTLLPAPAPLLRVTLGSRAKLLLASQRVLPKRLMQIGFDFSFPALKGALEDCCQDDDIRIERATVWPTSDYLAERPPSYVLEQELLVNARLTEVFEFFSDARNLSLLTPANLDFEIKTPDVNMAEGAQIDYRIRLGVLPMTWRSSIEVWEPGRRFVDAQRRGPYRSWWHEHTFEARPEGTLIRDRVYYAAPLGPLGRVANTLFVSPNLRRIFSYRRAATRLRFGPLARTATTRRLASI